MNSLTRRRFFQSLAALAVVAAVPLPVGLSPTQYRFTGYSLGFDCGSKDSTVLALVRSIHRTREIVAARVFNNAFMMAVHQEGEYPTEWKPFFDDGARTLNDAVNA